MQSDEATCGDFVRVQSKGDPSTVWPVKNRQMSIKVAQKWFN